MKIITQNQYKSILNYAYENYYSLVKGRLVDKKILEADEFDSHYLTFLKYISITSLGIQSLLPVDTKVDEIWHEFILQTKEYEFFCCSVLPGRAYIHHSSVSQVDYLSGASKGDDDFFEEQMYWLGYHYLNFGAFNEGELQQWKCTKFLCESLGMEIEGINEKAKTIADHLKSWDCVGLADKN